MVRKLGLFAVLVILTSLLSGCVVIHPDGQWQLTLAPQSLPTSTVVPQQSAGGSSGTSAGVSQGSTEPALPGGQLTSGPWKVQVERAYTLSRLSDGARPGAGKQFLLVDMAFQNTGLSAALLVFPKYFPLKNATGGAVSPFPTKLTSLNARSVRPVAARLGENTTLVYAIPADSGNYLLTFAPGQGASRPMSWLVP